MAEEFRVSIRNHRRLGIEKLKEANKRKEITDDDLKQSQERVQKITDEFIGRIEKVLKAKEDEIMEV
jgi:ribosome recycling factor